MGTRRRLPALFVVAALGACGSEPTGPKLRPPSSVTPRQPETATETDGTEPADDGGAPATSGSGPKETHVSDLSFNAVANGYGPVEADTSNGEDQPNDGNPITLAGVVYPKGLGVHAGSEIVVSLGGQYKTFLADVGVDDEVEDRGSVVFRVSVDGVDAFDSGVMTGASATQKVTVDVTGKLELRLTVTDAGDGIGSDHGDWAGARLLK